MHKTQVYPVCIPALYFILLRRQRHGIAAAHECVTSGNFNTSADGTTYARGGFAQPAIAGSSGRAVDPHLRALDFLWRPYKRTVYYWEVLECGRRLLLTGMLVFITPQTVAQTAYACVFAHAVTILYLRTQPHLGRADSYMYGLGQLIIFLTMFLSLLTLAGVTEVNSTQADAISGLMIFLNALLFAAIGAQVLFMGWSGSDDYWEGAAGASSLGSGSFSNAFTSLKQRISSTLLGGAAADGNEIVPALVALAKNGDDNADEAPTS
ncbi:hypothetical protein JKP88DRAFT_278627 [Tribonema minus]|uniref:TRP C-terminal domain-containing protein n=1 Tax=Tribonema minus TaxID=303371 RepID=A0A835YV27_9STRA|nr:hypothetical protein JKP88DRAFT_278627 [Tribonema minus]